jgi:monoamine oxidase
MLHSRFGSTFSPAERQARIEARLLRDEGHWKRATVSRPCTSSLGKIKVAVVGGGLAGLMAAKRLCEQGVAVTLFEAHAEVGGRVRSKSTKDRTIEYGAELIGSMHLLWRDLAIEYGLAYISRMDAGLYAHEGLDLRVKFKKGGKFLTRDELRDLEKKMEKQVLIPFADDAAIITNPAEPWLESRPDKLSTLQQWDNTSVATRLTELGIKDITLLKALELFLTNNNVAPLDEMNYLGLLCLVKGGQMGSDAQGRMAYWNELEIFRCADGCQTLAKKMAEEIQKKNGKVLRNTVVTDIDLKTRILKWKLNIGPKAKGNFKFDYVILAIPPSVWEKVNIVPHPKVGVGILGYGPATKFFSYLNDRFWIKRREAPSGGSLEIGQVWEGTENQIQVNTKTRRRGEQTIVLSVFTGGKKAPTDKEYRNGLKDLFETYPTSPHDLQTEPMDWTIEPFIETGYAAPKKGEIFTIAKKLLDPFEKWMFFAGEHTTMDFFGYMEGALQSGNRAATAVIRAVCPGEPGSAVVA